MANKPTTHQLADFRLGSCLDQNSMNVPFDTLCRIDLSAHTADDAAAFMRVMFGANWEVDTAEWAEEMEHVFD